MGKSRVEKNKRLYEELDSNEVSNHGLDLDAFELEDLSDVASNQEDTILQLDDLASIEQEEVKADYSEPILEIKEEKKESKVPVLTNEEEYVVEQPVSYNDMLIAEELLRIKLEKQKELKDSKRNLKRTPITETYTSEMMQKNIKQNEGVDVRKELNIKVKRASHGVVIALSILLVAVIAIGVALTIVILKN